MPILTPASVYRRFVTDGVPSSGNHKPEKAEIIQLLNLFFGTSRGGWVVAGTKAELDGVTPENETDGGVVLDDPTASNNGYYQRDASAWVKERGFPDTFARVTLGGTANAQTGAVSSSVNPADIEVFIAFVTTANTGPMTLSVGGETARDVVNVAGNPLSAGEWTGVVLFVLNDDGDYQLIIDAGAVAAAAQSASDAANEKGYAEEWAQSDDPVSVAAGGDGSTDRSSKHWAAQSATSANAASAVMTTVIDPQFATLSAAQAYAPIAAPDYIRTAGYSAAGDGGGALYKKVASEPAHAGKFSITLDDGVTVVWYEISPEDGIYRAHAFGLVSDLSGNDGYGTGTVSGADQATELQALFDAVPSGSAIDFADLKIRVNSIVNVTKNVKIVGDDALIYGNGGYLNVEGSLTEIGTVATATAVGDRTIALSSVAGLSVTDVIIIHNQVDFSFGPHRAQYHDGEYNEILSISGTTLTVKKALRGAYPVASTSKVFRLDGVQFSTKGINYEGDAAFVLRLNKTIDCEVDAKVRGGINHALSLQNNYRTRVVGGRYELFSPAASNEYGIAWSNSEDGYVAPGVYCFATRHPVSMGGSVGDGAVPTRNIVVEGVKMANSVDNIYAADMHGNAADCAYIDCDIDGGVGLAGKNVKATGGSVNARGNIRPLLYHELAGGYCIFDGMKVTFSPTATCTSVVGIAASSLSEDIENDFYIRANNLNVEAIASLSAIFSFYNNAIGTVDWTAEGDNLVLSGDISGLTAITALTVANTAGHSPAPVAARYVSQRGVQTLAAPAGIFVPTTSGNWAITRFDLTPIAGTAGSSGRYALMADGTLLCHLTASAGTTLWTFPFPFKAGTKPEVQITPVAAGVRIPGLGTVTDTSAAFNLYTSAGDSPNDVSVNLTAVGRYV